MTVSTPFSPVQLGSAVMVEDTSLCFNALKGLPGEFTHMFTRLVTDQWSAS